MALYCERCNGTFEGYHDECPACKRSDEFWRRTWDAIVYGAAIFPLYVFELILAFGLVLIAHSVAAMFGLSPLGLSMAFVILYALRRVGK